jgi:hypothetical protein
MSFDGSSFDRSGFGRIAAVSAKVGLRPAFLGCDGAADREANPD